ncbi:MAG TPA: DUF3192 domain-containing protein [Gammaproteobacteria bacterium]|nr:DUF3192 domain-containing protein [Gammaproteobacteria bacterium]
MDSSSIWRDLSGIKPSYLALLGVFVIGGAVYRFGDLDDDDVDVRAIRSGEAINAPVDFQRVENRNRTYLESISLGVLQAEVVRAIGQPDFREWFSGGFEMFMYLVENKNYDTLMSRDETAALLFRNGKLVGFSRTTKWFDTSVVPNTDPNYLRTEKNIREMVSDLKIGTPRQTILESLGKPAFVDYPGSEFEVLSYKMDTKQMDNLVSRNETVPLVLQDGKLAAVGLRKKINSGATDHAEEEQNGPEPSPGPVPAESETGLAGNNQEIADLGAVPKEEEPATDDSQND